MTIRDKQQLIDMIMDDPIYQEIFKKNLKSNNPDAILEITRREMKMKIEMNSNEMLFENEGETFSVVAFIRMTSYWLRRRRNITAFSKCPFVV